MNAPTSPASVTSTGNSRIRPAGRSSACVRYATRSGAGWRRWFGRIWIKPRPGDCPRDRADELQAPRARRPRRPVRALQRPRDASLLPRGHTDLRGDAGGAGVVPERPPRAPRARPVGDDPPTDGAVHRPLRAASLDDRGARRVEIAYMIARPF